METKNRATTLLSLLTDTEYLHDEELGAAMKLVLKKIEYHNSSIHSDGYNGRITHENRLVEYIALNLYKKLNYWLTTHRLFANLFMNPITLILLTIAMTTGFAGIVALILWFIFKE